MQRIKTGVALVLMVYVFGGQAVAQKIVDSTLGVYATQYQQEKMYIQYDKQVYNKGETIWYKAYLMTGTDPSEYSKNLYVDWYDASGKLLKQTAEPIFRSSARGQFAIPANYAGQVVRIKAYTQWMLNFDTAFLYNKEIPVTQILAKQQAPLPQPVTSIRFFPEGGDLVNGLGATVAFSATNQFGQPVSVSGAVKNSKNELIDSFVTTHDGMGTFTIDQPSANEKYTVYWADQPGRQFTATLPAVKNTGATLQVQPLAGKTLVGIKRVQNAPDNLKTLYLVATMNQQLVYRSKVNLTAKTAGLAEIPTDALPTAVLQITLFGSDWVPVAERVVFVNNHQHEFYTEVQNVIKSTAKRGKNVMEIYVSDSIPANLSIAVTDAGLGSDTGNNIISQLMLAGDIRGAIHNPAYYFSSDADSVAHHLDLVMLTHGWRRFKWDDVVQGKIPVLKNPRDSDYTEIKGKVFGSTFNKSPSGQTINVIIAGKDTASRQKQLIILPVNRDGSFAQSQIFFDTVRLFYMFNQDRKLTDHAEVRFQNGLLPPPMGTLPPLPFGGRSLFGDSAALMRQQFFSRMENRAHDSVHTLETVTVRSRAKSEADLMDEKYTSGMFNGGDSYQFPVANDPIAQSQTDVFRYLQGRVAGLNINNNSVPPSLSWRGGTPDLFLDERVVQPDVLQNMSMSNIAYIKVFRPPFFGSFGGGGGGAIAVYSRKGNDTKTEPVAGGLESTLLGGYSVYKEFYSPDYSTLPPTAEEDVRTTLYWNPYVLTAGRNRTVRLEFYNNDVTKRLRIIMEGVNAEGKVTHVEKIVE